MKIKTFTRPLTGSRRKLAYMLVVFFAVLIVWGPMRSLIHQRLITGNLVPQPEPFTELYFIDYPSYDVLPVAGEELQFSFTVHSHEGKTHRYNIDTYVESPAGEQQIIDFVSILMADGEQHTFSETLVYEPTLASSTIFVHLPEFDQIIRFKLIPQ